MNKIKWLVYLIGLGLLLPLFVHRIATAKTPISTTYTIQPGDSLSAIAYKIYNNESMWREIWKINPQIENPDLVYPGQIISLGPDIKIPSKFKPSTIPVKTYTREEVYGKLIKHMFKVNNEPFIDRKSAEGRVTDQKEFLMAHGISKLHSQRAAIYILQKDMKNLEYYYLLDGIFEACKNDPDYRMTALLVALAWQESDFNNAVGKHGEITQYQFLPSTVKLMLQLDDIGVYNTIWNLRDDPKLSSQLAYTWLMDNGANKRNTLKALQWYNRNPNYPYCVIHKYNKIIALIKS